jgi:hypothetical protein
MKLARKLIFLIKDDAGRTWGLAPTKLDARIQAAWFLPHGNKYFIEPHVISVNGSTQCI